MIFLLEANFIFLTMLNTAFALVPNTPNRYPHPVLISCLLYSEHITGTQWDVRSVSELMISTEYEATAFCDISPSVS
jgi:hypothetical protein